MRKYNNAILCQMIRELGLENKKVIKYAKKLQKRGF